MGGSGGGGVRSLTDGGMTERGASEGIDEREWQEGGAPSMQMVAQRLRLCLMSNSNCCMLETMATVVKEAREGWSRVKTGSGVFTVNVVHVEMP